MRAAEHIFSIVFVIFAFIRRSVQTLLRDNELVNDLGGLSHPLAMASVSSISRQSLRKKRLMCRDPTINRQNLPSDEAGCIRCEENDSFCDINRSANPWHECMALRSEEHTSELQSLMRNS